MAATVEESSSGPPPPPQVHHTPHDFKGEILRLGGDIPSDRNVKLFMEANNGNVHGAVRQYMSAMKFRAEVDARNIRINDVEKGMRARIADILANTDLPGHPVARDRKGRVLMLYTGRNVHPGELDPVDILRQVVYKCELVEIYAGHGYPEEVCSLCDMTGWKMSNFSPQLEKLAMDTMNQVYPGHVGLSLILNAPWYFRIAWNVCRPFIPKPMLERIVMVHGYEQLQEYIDPSNLPTEFGGKMNFDMNAWIANRYVVEGVAPGTPPQHKISSEIYSELRVLGMSAQDLSMTAIKSGSLDKRGAGVGFFGTTSWKKRYFVVTGTQLIYFDSGKGHDAHRCWDIRGAIVEPEIPDRPFGFAVSFTTGRRLMLAASSDEERREWLDVLEPIVAM